MKSFVFGFWDVKSKVPCEVQDEEKNQENFAVWSIYVNPKIKRISHCGRFTNVHICSQRKRERAMVQVVELHLKDNRLVPCCRGLMKTWQSV